MKINGVSQLHFERKKRIAIKITIRQSRVLTKLSRRTKWTAGLSGKSSLLVGIDKNKNSRVKV